MPLRKILVPLIGARRDESALAAALTVARDFNAHLEAFFVRPDPSEAMPFLGEGLDGSVLQDIVNAAGSAADKASTRARQMIERRAEETGWPMLEAPKGPGRSSLGFVEETGNFAECVGRRALLSDLVIFDNSPREEDAGITDALEDCLMARGRPVLLAPGTTPSRVGGNVTIGWDGSGEAAHAVHAAMAFLSRADRVQVLSVTRGQKNQSTTADLAAYLALHGIDCVEHVVDPEGHPVGEVLLREADRAGSDLLVIGGYGHSRIRELLIGGATRHVLSHPTLPVLMAH